MQCLTWMGGESINIHTSLTSNTCLELYSRAFAKLPAIITAIYCSSSPEHATHWAAISYLGGGGGRQANCIKRLLQSARLLVAHHQSKTLKVSHTHSHANTHGSANKSHTNARASRKACTGCHRRARVCVLHLESAPNAFQCTLGNLCARTAPQKHAQMNGLAALGVHTFICVCVCVYVLLKPIACSPRSNAEQTHISFRCVCTERCAPAENINVRNIVKTSR